MRAMRDSLHSGQLSKQNLNISAFRRGALRMEQRLLHALLGPLARCLTSPSHNPSPLKSPTPESNPILVTAQRSGAPMWTVDTETGSTVILVGEIRRVPKTTPWQPDRLKEAACSGRPRHHPRAAQILAGGLLPPDLSRGALYQAAQEDRRRRLS